MMERRVYKNLLPLGQINLEFFYCKQIAIEVNRTHSPLE